MAHLISCCFVRSYLVLILLRLVNAFFMIRSHSSSVLHFYFFKYKVVSPLKLPFIGKALVGFICWFGLVVKEQNQGY